MAIFLPSPHKYRWIFCILPALPQRDTRSHNTHAQNAPAKKKKPNPIKLSLAYYLLSFGFQRNQLLFPKLISKLDSKSRFSQDTKHLQFLLRLHLISWPLDPPSLKSSISGDEESSIEWKEHNNVELTFLNYGHCTSTGLGKADILKALANLYSVNP